MGDTTDQSENEVQRNSDTNEAGQQGADRTAQTFDGPDGVDDVEAALDFDFFNQKPEKGENAQSEGTQKREEGKGKEPKPDGADDQTGEKGANKPGQESRSGTEDKGKEKAPGQGTQTGAQTSGPSEMDRMRAQMEELRQANARLEKQIEATPKTEGQNQGQEQDQGEQGRQKAQQDAQELARRYAVNLDPQMMQLIASDDPDQSAQGIQRLVQSLGAFTHQQVMRDVQQHIERAKSELQESLPQMMNQQQAAQKQNQSIWEDFYGTYPHFNKDGLHQLVAQTANEVSQEMGVNQWSTYLRDATAQKLQEKLNAWNGGQGQGQALEQTQAPAPRKPSFDTGGTGTRGGHSPQDPNSSQEIGDTLFG